MCIDKDMYTHLIILIMKFLEEENFKESLQAYGDVSILLFFLNKFFEFLFVEIVLLCGLLIEVFDVDWSKSRRFSSTCIVLGKMLWMVNGKRRRSIFQHLRNWMIVIIQRKCSSSCASISTVKLYAGISFKNGGLRFAYSHYVMWAFAFS